ncbi:MAG: YdcF family protein [Alphaproteobacteria bacterium]
MGMIVRLVKRGLWLGLAVLALTIGAVMYFSDANLKTYGQGRALAEPVDAILVLGGGVDGDGVLGYSSRRRVVAAVELLRAGRAEWLILSGATGCNRRAVPAARLMRAHAIALGAPEAALIVEGGSASTFENLRFGLALARERGFENVAILTDAFHLERARALSGYLGHPDVALVAAWGLEIDGDANRVWSIVREALAWWYNLAKVAAWEALTAAGMDENARQELIR